ncbi:MAG: DUF4037 domain-containing protein [Nocardioides sp.]
MSAFVHGLDLSRRFYRDGVRPILDAKFPGLPHGAGLLGRGSEVLGFDDEMSTDHDWKPRVLIFLRQDDQARDVDAVSDSLRRELPPSFGGRPVDLEIHTVRNYFLQQLDVDVDAEIETRDWLTFPEHGLRMFTSGEVFHDGVGLQEVRNRLAYYPRDVWLYLLMAGWWRVHPEANLMGRAGSVGDELGSALIGSRLVSDLMRLCFLMERQYAPYSKWFGTAFSRLECGPELSPILWRVVQAETWPEREKALLTAYEKLAEMHNALGLTEPVVSEVEQLWNRPFKVAWADFPGLLGAQIQDPTVLGIAERWPTGPVDQFRELLWPARNRRLLLRLFDQEDSNGGRAAKV